MIVRPSQQDYQEYLTTCLNEKLNLFRSIWTQHLSGMIHQPSGSVTDTPSVAQARDLYSRVLGFSHWPDLMHCLKEDACPWDDPRFQYLDMNPDLITHLDSDFMASLQSQRLRLYSILKRDPIEPATFFSVYEGDHGPVESALLLMHRIPSSALSTHLQSLFVLNKRRVVLSAPGDDRHHMMIQIPQGSSFGISDILSTCQVPAMVFGHRKDLTARVAKRFYRREITLANTRRNLTATTTWTVNQHLEYLASIMVDPYPEDTMRENIRFFLYFMINWMINESPNGEIHLDYPSLSAATDLNNYHIDNLSNGRGGHDLNTLSVAVTPAIFLREPDETRFKSLARHLVYGAELSAEDYREYERLFKRAVTLSRPARGLMLTDLSEHLPVLMPNHLHHPHSDIIFFDQPDVISASHWFNRQLHIDGMKHIIEEMENLGFGGAIFTRLPDADSMSDEDHEALQYLMESCDNRKIQLVMLSEDSGELFPISNYCHNYQLSENDNELIRMQK